MKITPIRAYERKQGWEAYPLQVRSKISIRLGLLDYATPAAISFTAGGPLVPLEGTRGEVIALDTRQTTPDKRLFSARLVGPVLDVQSVKEAVRNCAESHPNCGSSWASSTRSASSSTLSLLVRWQKSKSSLQAGIRDIDGHTFFTAPPVMTAEINASVWDTRAWTLQEMSISRRTLFVFANQARFECGLMSADEADDTTTFGTENSPFISGNLIMFSGILASYTVRKMTNESDSINAFLGMLAVLKRRLFPSGFVHGLPLYRHPESLAWFHDRNSVPKRRPAFPSWSWAGWEGQVFIPEVLVEPENDRLSVQTDLTVELVSANDKEIVLSGWFVTLDIRTAPFSEAFNPRTNELIGFVVERNFRTNTTIPSGVYSCLVVQRVTRSRDGKLPGKQHAFLLVLDWVTRGTVARRKTLLTVMPFIKDGSLCGRNLRGGLSRSGSSWQFDEEIENKD
ncbi:hypothetical protein GE09DRAFT_1280566 [Coniochaeta sp. 2T2.1]|nr:hypothetical protein GE09DRAFT_1280566 [Coniochaeta sp. 2T2.1]